MPRFRPRWRRLALVLLALGLSAAAGVSHPAAAEEAPKDPSRQAPAGSYQTFLPLLTHNYHPIAPGLPIDPYANHSGEGTYYDATGAGNCSFPATPGNLMVAAMNELDYGDAIYCGAFIRITGPQGSVVVRIVDRCPECAPGDVDMSPQAFAQIAPISAGRVAISWRVVDSGIASPIALHFKEGSSQWWAGIQVRNHRTGIFKLEYQVGGVFQPIHRERYNYFVQANMGPGPHTLRITDFYGRAVIQSGVTILNNAESPTALQFPPAP